RGILFNVTGGSDLGLFEVNEAAEVIKEAADPEANIIFGTVIDDRMRDEVKVTVIATGFDGTRYPKPGPRTAVSEKAVGLESSLDEKSRELLAEIERERAERSPFAVTPASSEPLPVEPEPGEVGRSRGREPVPSRPTSLERPAYGETDLDIPSFLRQPNREQD
ncbi:MAG: cell division protein FtsZ, partial [Chloroflexota bacterium]|nr:cell division protein FtsZ [Chloroflexota bacterium]